MKYLYILAFVAVWPFLVPGSILLAAAVRDAALSLRALR